MTFMLVVSNILNHLVGGLEHFFIFLNSWDDDPN